MCLALPALVESVHDDGHATVSLDGIRKRVSLALTPDAPVGSYVIVHVGYAIGTLDPEEARETLRLFGELAASRDEVLAS